LRAVDPGIFLANGLMAVFDQTGTQITPGYPAPAGAVLAVYATGLGAVSPAVQSGQVTPTGTLFSTVASTTITVGGIPASVVFSGLTPGFVGLYQVNFTLPPGLASGNQPLVMHVGGISTSAMSLAIQ
jgi:uncharacterized protein (TIGR03437 family)